LVLFGPLTRILPGYGEMTEWDWLAPSGGRLERIETGSWAYGFGWPIVDKMMGAAVQSPVASAGAALGR